MMDTLRRYPLISGLAIVAALLAGVLALEFFSGRGLRERIAGGSGSKPVTVQTKLLPTIAAVNPDAEYAETGNRPLFIPTRRPAPPLAGPAAIAAMTKGQFTLTGVTIAGATKIALLREKSSGRVVRVEEGKEVNGITVAQIDPEQVTLTQGGDREVVALLVTKGPAPSPAAVAAPASAGPFAPPAQPAAGVPPAGANPTARPMPPPPVAGPAPAPAPGAPNPFVNPNSQFGPRPGGLTPDPTTAAPATSQATPLTPEELLARRRARRNQQTQ